MKFDLNREPFEVLAIKNEITSVIMFIDSVINYLHNDMDSLKGSERISELADTFVSAVSPIFDSSEFYASAVENNKSGYVVFDIDDLKHNSVSNIITVYDFDENKKLVYNGIYFSNQNVNLKNLLHHKIIFTDGKNRSPKNWGKRPNYIETTYEDLIYFFICFFYFDLQDDDVNYQSKKVFVDRLNERVNER